VEFLDDLNEVDDNHPLIKGMSNLEVYKIEEYKEKLNNSTLNFLSNDALIKEKYKEGIISFLKSINENEEIRKKFSESIAQAKDMLNVIGASNNTFDEYLEMLNEDYKKYREAGREKIKEIDEEIKSQFGFTWTEFLENSVTISK
jgi:DNA-binding Lrp family transcriptional regulator